jgi:8-oxo-dGTP diphosphatase
MRRSTSHGRGTWAAPGGFLEFGESPEDCAIRELKEETRLVVDEVRFITFTNDRFEDSGKHDITLWFETEHEAEELEPTEEASEVRWFRIDQMPHPLFLPLSNLLKKNPLR